MAKKKASEVIEATETIETVQVEIVETEAKQNIEAVPLFDKEQLLNSKRYREQKDLLNVVLEDGKQYSFETVDQEVEKLLKKGKVK